MRHLQTVSGYPGGKDCYGSERKLHGLLGCMYVAAGRIVWINNGNRQTNWHDDTVMAGIKTDGFRNDPGHGHRNFSH